MKHLLKLIGSIHFSCLVKALIYLRQCGQEHNGAPSSLLPYIGKDNHPEYGPLFSHNIDRLYSQCAEHLSRQSEDR